MIMLTALLLADGRLYEAAESLAHADAGGSSSRSRCPARKYGLVSAAMVVFSYTVSDFGIPKVIGGNFNVLAVDIFKQVIGQQNFNKGAVVGLILLLPVRARVRRRLAHAGPAAGAVLGARGAVRAEAASAGSTARCSPTARSSAMLLLAVLGMAVYTSFIKLWPYDKSFSLRHYTFGLVDGGVIDVVLQQPADGVARRRCSARCSSSARAYLLEKTRGARRAARRRSACSPSMPMAVPGMVLGLGYIFFFNHPANPLNGLYDDMTILVLSTIVHYYTSSHLTAVTALKALDNEFEAVSASLKVPFYKTFFRVTVPVCLPAILDIGRYFFVNAMVTHVRGRSSCTRRTPSSPSVAILNLDEAGEIGAGGRDGDADRRDVHRRVHRLRAASRACCCARTQAWRTPAAP